MGVATPRTGPHVVHTVHRMGAGAIGLFLMVFGVVGFVQGVPMVGAEGTVVMGLYANGLLAGVSVIVGVVLAASAVRGGPTASMVSVVVGALFLLSGLGNALLLGTAMNLLAFRLPNIVFSLAVGAVLLILGSYGRFTGKLPPDSPYHQYTSVPPDLTLTVQQHQERLRHRGGAVDLADAERADALRQATAEQRRRLDRVDSHGSHDDRLRGWEESG